uniref:TSA: Wollemia nobilis Ref_Wollemi_Transcript_8016_703 transcribed RNA sequence n=1 Tax=Wollemia nobilis TaxID=56998 RepID=A0A0C9S9E1_9CONI
MASLVRPTFVCCVRSSVFCRPCSKSIARALLFRRGLTSTALAHSSRLSGSFHGGSHQWGFKLLSQGFCVRATEVSDPGSVDSPMMQGMQKKIKEQLNAEEVIVKDAYGDGRHVSIDVISSAFEGQSHVNRQRMVYKAIWEELQNTVHAVDQMTTRTPAEAAEASK